MRMKSDKKRATTQEIPVVGSRPVEWLTQIAFVLALALVLARATTGDFSKNRSEPLTSAAPRVGGPAASIGLDLLCCLPAILILSRRVSDRTYVLRWSWSVAGLAALALLGLASTIWASNKFWAMLSGFHLMAALAMLWAASQLVRSWLRFRMVGAVYFGLLIAFFAYALLYQFVDVPDQQRYFQEHKAEILKERGLDNDPFAARQFENKMRSHELIGFYTSANTMAAMTVLVLIVSIGLGVQRALDDRTDATGAGLLIVSVPAAAWMIFEARSKTAAMTPILAVVALAAIWRWRDPLARHARRAFWAGVACVALAVIAVVAHGLYHHGLPGESLTFRWYYWVGAMRILVHHAFVGVGLDNFGNYYTGVRLPVASEEVKDPHNVFVRFLVELGVPGGLLCLAWVGRLAWELTRPVAPTDNAVRATTGPAYRGVRAISGLAWIATVGLALSVVVGVDFSADKGYVLFEILKKTCLFALLLVGASVGSLKSVQAPELDPRPAPVLLYATLVALAAFLLHNLIDFSFFEPGPMIAFAFLAGCALGVRQPSVAGRARKTALAAVALAVCVVGWLIGAGFAWAPTAAAEDDVAEAATDLRAGRATEAVRMLKQAHVLQRLNSDYAFKAAQVAISAGGDVYSNETMELLATAIRADPMQPSYFLTRAGYLLHTAADGDAHREQIRSDFRRAIALDPNEVSFHVDFADALRTFNTPADRDEAVREYESALRFNSLLKPNEPKRLGEAKVAEIQKRIEELQQKSGR